jgi:hypothetical protein
MYDSLCGNLAQVVVGAESVERFDANLKGLTGATVRLDLSRQRLLCAQLMQMACSTAHATSLPAGERFNRDLGFPAAGVS